MKSNFRLILSLCGLLWSFHGLSQTTTSTTFNSSGNWVAPAGVTRATIECWGGGGAGGGTSTNTALGGGGGAGGAYASSLLTVTPSTSYTVTVGGTQNGAQSAGAAGNPSWFNTVGTVFAQGGAGGAAPNGVLGALGGTGSAASSIGNISTIAGANGANGTALVGGAGGAGGNGGGAGGAQRNSENDGAAGTAPGGGGGGAFLPDNTNHSGGNGAAGRVIVTWVVPPTITNLSPNKMCDGASIDVTITGTNFTGASTVTFNGVSVPFVINSATTITATVPGAGISTGNVVVTNNNNFSTSTATFSVYSASSAPGAITGVATICPSITGVTYSVAAVTGASTYTWTVPTGWSITAGQGTTSITVTSGLSGQNGNVSVTTDNTCNASTKAVTVECNTWYSYQTGDYNDFNTWTLDPSGSTFDNPANAYPSSYEEIVILNGFTVTVNLNSQILSSTVIEGGAILDMSTSTGNNLGTITGTGLLRVQGTSLPAGTYTDFVSVLGGTIEYYNVGGTLSTTQTEYNKLKMTNSTGSNIIYILAGNLTVNGTFDLTTTGAGTVTWQINNATNASRTITLYDNLTIASGGRITAGTGNSGSTTQHTLTTYGNITNNGIVQFFDPTDGTYSGANYTSGAIYTAGLRGNAVNVIFSGTTNNTLTCTNQTDFYRLVLDKGTGQLAMLTVQSNNTSNFRLFGPNNITRSGAAPNYQSNNNVSIINGTLQLTGSINIPSLIVNNGSTSSWPIPQNGALWLNGANVTVQVANTVVAGNKHMHVFGLLRVTNGTLDLGYSLGLLGGGSGYLRVEGGTINTWQLRTTNLGTGNNFSYVQSGGTVNVATAGLTGIDQNDYPRFSLTYTTCSFQMSGGTLNVGNPMSGGVGDTGGIQINTSTANTSVTGGTVNAYLPASAINFTITSTAPFYNLNINKLGAGTSVAILNGISADDGSSTIVEAAQPLVVLNNLTLVSANSPTLDCNSNNLTVGGNLSIETGTTLTTGTNTVTFNGTGAQTLTNNGTISTLANTTMVVNKTAGTILTLAGTTSPVIPATLNTLTLTSGTLADGGSTVTVTTNLTNNATHTSTGSGNITYSGTNAIGGTNGTFGNLTISTNNTVATSGNQTVTGTLRLLNASTSLNIGSNALNALGNIYSDGATGVAFTNTKRIITSGLHNAGGLTRQGAAGNILFPVGTGSLYTPNTINVTATIHGTITVRPVSSEHPNVASVGQSVQYYWRVTSSGYSGITAVTHSSYHYSTATEGNPTANYRVARFDRSTNLWGYDNTTTFNATTSPPIPTFSTGTGWTISGDRLDGEYTCGNASAFNVIQTYYSKASGNWSTLSTWTLSATHSGADVASAPCSTCPVVIGDGVSINHTITIDNHNLSCGSLDINTGSTLDCVEKTGLNFGTGTGGVISGRGTLKIGSPNFPAGDFTTFIGSTGGTVEWYAFTNNGALRGTLAATSGSPTGMTIGTYTNVTASATSGSGTGARFTVVVGAANTITSVTVTQAGRDYANGNTITFNGSLFGGAGSRVYTLAAANLGFEIPAAGPAPQFLNLSTYYNLIVNPASTYTIYLPKTNLTVYNNFTQQTGTGTVNNVGAFNLAVTNNLAVSAGTFTLTNAGNTAITVGGSVTNSGTFNATGGTHTLSIVGGLTNNGTLNFNNTGTVGLTFTGTNNVSLTGTGTGGTTLYTLTVNKGTSQTPTLTIDVSGTVTAANSGWLTLTNGTAYFNNSQTYTIVSTAATFTIPSTAKLRVGAGTVNALTNSNDAADLLLNGALEVSGTGTVNVAGGTNGNDIEYASAGTPTITVSGSGVLNVNGSIRRSTTSLAGALVYNQTGGTVTVSGRNSSTARGVFEIDANTGSSFTMTGASVLNVQRQTGGSSYADVYINPVASNVASTSTITVGLSTATTQTNFRINIAPTIGNFTIQNGAGTNAQTVRMYSNPLLVGGALTIPTPSVLITNSLDVSIAGDLVCTGTYTGGTNNTSFNGTGGQTGQLSSTSTFYDFTIDKTAGTTLGLSGTSPTLQNLYILSGILDVGTLALDVRRNITNNSSQVGSGSILIYSTASSNTITSSNGSFTNITLGGTATTKTITVNGNATIKGALTFPVTETRYFSIGSNRLTFDVSATTLLVRSIHYRIRYFHYTADWLMPT